MLCVVFWFPSLHAIVSFFVFLALCAIATLICVGVLGDEGQTSVNVF